MIESVTVEAPNSTVVVDREYCLRSAASMLVAASENFGRYANRDVPIDLSNASSLAVQAQTALAQAYLALHDRLEARRGFGY